MSPRRQAVPDEGTGDGTGCDAQTRRATEGAHDSKAMPLEPVLILPAFQESTIDLALFHAKTLRQSRTSRHRQMRRRRRKAKTKRTEAHGRYADTGRRTRCAEPSPDEEQGLGTSPALPSNGAGRRAQFPRSPKPLPHSTDSRKSADSSAPLGSTGSPCARMMSTTSHGHEGN